MEPYTITRADPRYPKSLLDLSDPPASLRVLGELRAGGTAIVGSRTPPIAMLRAAGDAALVCPQPMVSGLSAGIDAAAHEAALAAGRATIAYVPHGVASPDHPELQARVAHCGAVISEFADEKISSEGTRRQRDRLIAAHARQMLVICSERDGGAVNAARIALELGRNVYVFEAEGEAFEGNRQVLKNGAEPLTPNTLAYRMAEQYNPHFTSDNLDAARSGGGEKFDALPFGVVVVDRSGKVVAYNEYEHQLGGHQPVIVGKHFFKEVAPWSKDFETRWDDFVGSSSTSIIPFDFVLPTNGGSQEITVMFVRVGIDDEHAMICIAKKVAAENA